MAIAGAHRTRRQINVYAQHGIVLRCPCPLARWYPGCTRQQDRYSPRIHDTPWRWQARHVKLDVAASRNMFDGTTVSMPDTPSNQQAFTQSREQKPSLGSLVARISTFIGLGDVVLADALLATWWIIEGVLARGDDAVMAQHGCRITDFTRGESLGGLDHMVDCRVHPGQSR